MAVWDRFFRQGEDISTVEDLFQAAHEHIAFRELQLVSVNEDAKKWILNKTLTDRAYGARPLRRALQKYIEDPLSEALIQGTFTTRPAFIEVFLEGDKLFYRPVGEENVEGVLLYSN